MPLKASIILAIAAQNPPQHQIIYTENKTNNSNNNNNNKAEILNVQNKKKGSRDIYAGSNLKKHNDSIKQKSDEFT